MIKQLSESEEIDLYDKCCHYFKYDNGKLFWKSPKKRVTVGNEVGSLRPDGYRHLYLDQRCYFTHHIVWLMHKGEYPKSGIDHCNGQVSDNRIENLRAAEQWQNRGNSVAPKDRELPMGVHKTDSGKFMALFRNKHIVTSDSISEAHDAYITERKNYYGSFFHDGSNR